MTLSALRRTPGYVVVVALLLIAACGGGGKSSGGDGGAQESVETQLVSVVATGATTGGQGKLRIVFSNPVSSDTTVTLSTVAPAIATVPATVTVTKGTLEATVTYTAASTGDTLLTATSGGTTVTTTLYVVDQLQVTGVQVTNGEVGAPGAITVSLNIAPAAATDVMLVAANPSIVTTAATAHFAEFESVATASISYVAIGSTSITATLGTSTSTAPVTVVDHARLISLSLDPYTAANEVGAVLTLTVQLDAVVAKSTPITVTSSAPNVVAAPTLTVGAGNSTASTTVKLAAAGSSNLVFTLADSALTQSLYADTSGVLQGLTATGTNTVGQALQLTVLLSDVAVTAHDIALTSSDPTVLAVPAKITVEPGSSSATIDVTPLKAGGTAISANYDGVTREVLVVVGNTLPTEQPGLVISAGGQLIAVGAISAINVNVYNATTQQTVTLTSSDPTVVAVPPSISTSTSTAVQFTALKAGIVTITATGFGITSTATIHVVAQAEVTSVSDSYYGTLPLGALEYAVVIVSAQAPLGLPITLTSSNPGVVTVPSTVYTNGSNEIQFLLQTVASGSSIITATLGTSTVSGVINVGTDTQGTVPPATPVFVVAGVSSPTLQVGASTLFYGEFSAPLPADLPVTLTTSQSGIIKLVSTSTVAVAGTNEFIVPFTALANGTTTISATVGTTTLTTATVTVQAPIFSIYVPATMNVGKGQLGEVLNNGTVLAADTAFTVSSSDSTILAVTSGMGTVEPGVASATATFALVPKAAGMVTITVKVGTQTLTQMVTVSP